VVATFGDAALFEGPALIGFLVHQLGLHHAMIMSAKLCAGIAFLAATMPKSDADLKS
jgi:hypothetical protein